MTDSYRSKPTWSLGADEVAKEATGADSDGGGEQQHRLRRRAQEFLEPVRLLAVASEGIALALDASLLRQRLCRAARTAYGEYSSRS